MEGLEPGENQIEASSGDSAGMLLSVTNHPSSGPIFSGPHLEPWVCAQPSRRPLSITNPDNGDSAIALSRESGLSSDTDADCNAPAEVAYYYQPATAPANCRFDIEGDGACFVPFNPSAPPADGDIARFTNDRGDEVRSIIAVEEGTINRGMYSLVAFRDPAASQHPAEPQRGWNGKLMFRFGGSAGGSRFQTQPGRSPFFDRDALRQGYMLAVSSLNDHGTNSNHALAAETLMMLKEHITEQYGGIRFTIGTGGSGGAIMQLTMASAYPGLLDGLIPSLTYADALTNTIEIFDCGIFADEYQGSSSTRTSLSEHLAITGHASPLQCTAWNIAFLPLGDPGRATNCGLGFPDSLVFSASSNPQGIRCSYAEHARNILGRSTGPDGIERADPVFDNVGVQYGLRALQQGEIDAELFVNLNENIGSYDADQNFISGPARAAATEEGLNRAYRSGMVTSGRYLARVPIIDLRSQEGDVDIHLNWRAKSVRDRLVRANGHHDNQLIWAHADSEPSDEALATMDAWLSAIEADAGAGSLEEKVVRNRPAAASDLCLVDGVDVGLDTPACPIKFGASPRQVAGGPVAEDVLKCQLKPLDLTSSDYAGISFTADQQNRLAMTFPDGVCDWSQPGVGQQQPVGWMSFANGPGGEPLELQGFDRTGQ